MGDVIALPKRKTVIHAYDSYSVRRGQVTVTRELYNFSPSESEGDPSDATVAVNLGGWITDDCAIEALQKVIAHIRSHGLAKTQAEVPTEFARMIDNIEQIRKAIFAQVDALPIEERELIRTYVDVQLCEQADGEGDDE